MNASAYSVIRDAVQRKLQVTRTYHGRYREICPHVLGSKNGKPHVLAFQFGGQSSSGLPPGGEWRCMNVDEISSAVSRPGQWHTGYGHQKPQTCVDEVDVEVAY